MSRRVVVALALVAACGGNAGKGSAPQAPGGARTGWHPALAGTVTLVEVDDDGETHAIGPGASVEVDINSRIELRVDRTEVAKILGARVGEAAAIEASAKRLAALTTLTEEQRAIIGDHDALVGAATLTDAARAPRQEALGKREQALGKALAAYAAAQGYGDDRVDAFFASDGAEGVYAALDVERRAAIEEADALLERVAGMGWRMQATLSSGDKSSAVHLEGYDEYESGPFRRVDKLVPATEHLPQQLAEANRLAAKLGDLAGARDLFLAHLRTRLRESVDSARKAVLADLRTLEAFPDRVVAAVRTVDGVKELREAAVELAAQAKGLEAACRPVIAALERGQLPELSSDAMVCAAAIQKAAKPIVDAAAKAKAAVGRIRAASVAAVIRAELDKLEDDLVVLALIDAKVEVAKEAWKTIEDVLKTGRPAATAPVWRDDHQIDRTVADLTDSAIDLPRTDRKDGDRIEFRASVVDRGVPVVTGGSTVMHVVRTGLYIDASAAVLFLQEIDDAHDPLEAAPAIVAAAHYRFRERGRWPGARRFINFVQPGLGIHFATPDLGRSGDDMTDGDPPLEMGVGATVLLFGDLLQAGIGRDLQVGVTYGFVGFGLNTIGKLGVRVPL